MKILDKEITSYFMSKFYEKTDELFSPKLSDFNSDTQHIVIDKTDPVNLSVGFSQEVRDLFHSSDITLPYILIPSIQLGEDLPTNIVETSEYTGTIIWTPHTGVYMDETAYHLTVILTPKAGYNKYGIPENFFSFCPTGIIEREHFISTLNEENSLTIYTTMLINMEVVDATGSDISRFTVTPDEMPAQGGEATVSAIFEEPSEED
jgi:hypothetical protein